MFSVNRNLLQEESAIYLNLFKGWNLTKMHIILRPPTCLEDRQSAPLSVPNAIHSIPFRMKSGFARQHALIANGAITFRDIMDRQGHVLQWDDRQQHTILPRHRRAYNIMEGEIQFSSSRDTCSVYVIEKPIIDGSRV